MLCGVIPQGVGLHYADVCSVGCWKGVEGPLMSYCSRTTLLSYNFLCKKGLSSRSGAGRHGLDCKLHAVV